MGRKRIDEDYEAAKTRLQRAIAYKPPENSNDRDFSASLKYFVERWRKRGCPDLYWEERDAYWDEEQHCMVYRGMYYELRELCDRFSLYWACDRGYLIQWISRQKDNADIQTPETVLTTVECPPAEHWRWFRMARTGLKLPRASEIKKADKASAHRTSTQDHARLLTSGLTQWDIAQMHHTNPRTVGTAIKKCWEYLEQGGISLNHIADLAGLVGDEIFLVFLASRPPIESEK